MASEYNLVIDIGRQGPLDLAAGEKAGDTITTESQPPPGMNRVFTIRVLRENGYLLEFEFKEVNATEVILIVVQTIGTDPPQAFPAFTLIKEM